jgi:type IV pilus assembly protein PilW
LKGYKTNRDYGYSIIELLIAASIGLVLVSFIHNIVSKTLWVVKEIEASAEVLESAQYLIGLLSREIGLAGFFGDFSTASLPSSAAPALCQLMSKDQVIKAMPYAVAGIDNVANGYKLCGRDTVLPGTDVILLRRSVIDQKQPRYKLQSQQIYIQGSFASSNPIIEHGDHSASFILRQGNIPKPVRAWQQTLYYVSKDNTFKRRRFLNGRYLGSEPLIDGVQDFQVEYVVRKLDVTSGCGEEYLSAPLTDAQWKRVVALRVHFLLRSSWQGQSQKSKVLEYANRIYVIQDDGYYELFKVLAPIMNKL